MQAIYDVWFIGDAFFREIHATLLDMRNSALVNKINPPYVFEYYNVFGYMMNANNGTRRTVAHILNAAIEGLNSRERLPHFIVVIIDKDIIEDINMFDHKAGEAISQNLRWLMRQVNTYIKRKCLEILDKKPGAIYGGDPKIIYISVIKQAIVFPRESRMESVVALCHKFNKILNEEVEANKALILNVESCTREHFDFFGRLNARGKFTFWSEVNYLLQRLWENLIRRRLPCSLVQQILMQSRDRNMVIKHFAIATGN